jgi:hypothetical protein
MSDFITSLDDLAPVVDQVSIGEKQLIVNPLDLAQIGALMYKHKILRDLFDGSEEREVDIFDAVMDGGKAVICDLVDFATGITGLGERLTGIQQGNVIFSCLSMTLPEEKGEMNDFLAQLTALATRAKMIQE